MSVAYNELCVTFPHKLFIHRIDVSSIIQSENCVEAIRLFSLSIAVLRSFVNYSENQLISIKKTPFPHTVVQQ